MKVAKKPVIGLTGAVGAGKSTVAAMFARLGCGIINADRIAHEVLDRPEVIRQLTDWWGPQVLNPQGRIDHAAVGAIVFNQPPQMKRLEALVHPLVHQRRLEQRDQLRADPAVIAIVEDCPLLFETGIDQTCDVTVLVDTPREIRLERVRQSRGWDEAVLARREKMMLPLDKKRQLADYVIDNSACEAETFSNVQHAFSLIHQPLA